ncbi:MAG: DUF364 domain-containing protein [Synergistales bacterium]|nr:DUF364 domain-containing protein [Synergistales bacterium]
MEEHKCHCTRPFAEAPERAMTGDERLLVDRLIASMAFPDDRVDEVLLGPKQIFIRSGDRGALATTLGSSSQRERFRGEKMQGATLKEAASLLYDDLLLNRSLGAAALNVALAPVADEESPNALELLLQHGKGRDVVVVGDFPFTERLREHARRLYLLELKDTPDRLAPEKWDEALSACDVVGMTGTALLSRSMAHYLKLSSRAYRVILGATTPLSEVLLKDYGVDVLAGSVVADIEGTRQGVLAGLSISKLHRTGCLDFCNMTRRSSRQADR